MILTYLDALKAINEASEKMSRSIVPFLAVRKDPEVVLQALNGVTQMITLVDAAIASGALTPTQIMDAREACFQARRATADVEDFLKAELSPRSNG